MVWPQNHSNGFHRFGLKTGDDGFSRVGLKTVLSFLVEPQNQGGGGFFDLSLKIGSSGLVIWALKSPQQFLVLCLKTKRALIFQLRHKTNRGRSVWDTR
jgi:hypothetical protein